MDSPALASLHKRLCEIDRDLLRALAARARFPRHPLPAFPDAKPHGACPPPIPEILYALCPAGTAASCDEVAKANNDLVAALLARQNGAGLIADARFDLLRADALPALETGDREKMAELLADMPAELRQLDFIRTAAGEWSPDLPPGLALFLWREYILPWARQSELEHLLAP